MLRTFVCLFAVLPTLLPPGVCVCQFVPQTSAAVTKPTETPRRQRCSCCRPRPERPLADSSTRQKTPGHGWNESTPTHDSACPMLNGSPLPRLVDSDASQIVTGITGSAIAPLPHPLVAALDPPGDPPPLSLLAPHLGYSVLRI